MGAHLASRGIGVVLVGGAVVAVYSQGAYTPSRKVGGATAQVKANGHDRRMGPGLHRP